MKKAWLLILGALLLPPASAHAQTIRGVVLEDGTRTPIVDASVELLAPDASRAALVRTDSVGEFVLVARGAGDYFIRLTHLAYAPLDSVALPLRPGETLEIELYMAQRAIPIEPVVVTARRRSMRLDGFYERSQSRASLGRYLTREDIESRAGARSTELLRMMPGVQLVDVGYGRNLILMRGGGTGRCMPTIYLDGMEVRQFAESGVDDFLTPDMLEGVEVYTSFASAPSPLHARNNCGVVAFWTRTGEGGGRWSWRRFAIGVGGFALLVLLSR